MKQIKKLGIELYYKRGINLLKFTKPKSTICFPSTLIIELTRNCNGHCIMCSRKKSKYNPKLNMPLELFKKIADETFPHAKNIDLRGFGESTLIPNFLATKLASFKSLFAL